MITQKHFLAAFGFALVAAWIAFGFGNAILCLLGAAVFYGIGAVLEGEIDLGELQQRVRGSSPDPAGAPAPYGRSPRAR